MRPIPLTQKTILSNTSVNGNDGYNNFIKDNYNNLYSAFTIWDEEAKPQIAIYKSSDNGETWTDMLFPASPIYGQQLPSIAIDSSSSLHVVWFACDNNNTAHYQIKYSTNKSGSWSSPINIQTISGYLQQFPSIAIDSQNNCHVIWHGQDNGTKHSIKYSTNKSGSWSNWINIQPAAAPYNQMKPSFVIDSSDNLHVVCQGQDATTAAYQVKYSTNKSGSWSAWVNVALITGYAQDSPVIAIDANNNLHVAWQGTDSSNSSKTQIKYSNNKGGAWSAWVNVSTNANTKANVQQGASITLDNFGNAHILWSGAGPGTTYATIHYTSNIAGGVFPAEECMLLPATFTTATFTSPKAVIINNEINIIYVVNSTIKAFVLEKHLIFNQCVPISVGSGDRDSLIVDKNSNAIYLAIAKTFIIYIYRSLDGGKTWTDMLFPSIPGREQYWPNIAVDSKGFLHVVWGGLDDVNTNYQQIKYSTNKSGSWSTPVNIQTISGYRQSSPSIAIDSDDNPHVVWQGPDSAQSYEQVKYSTNKSGAWSSWINISPLASNQYLPSLVIDSQDNLHVAFSSADPANANYQIKYINNKMGSWGGWTNITNDGNYAQGGAKIAIDSNDNLHIVWYGPDKGSPTKNQVKYSTNKSGAWSLPSYIIADPSYIHYMAYITIDSNDYCHVTWVAQDSYNGANYLIRYGTNKTGTWTIKPLSTAAGYTSLNPLIALLDDNPIIEVVASPGYRLLCIGQPIIAEVKYLFRKQNGDICTFQPDFQIIGNGEPTYNMFKLNGMLHLPSNINSMKAIDTKLELLVNENGISPTNKRLRVITNPSPKLILMNNDISLSGAPGYEQIEISYNVNNNSLVRFIVSVDSGVTYKTFKGGTWNNISTDKTDVKINGMAPGELANLTKMQLTNLCSTSQKIRFGYYIEMGQNDDICNVNYVRLRTTDNESIWEIADNGIDYKCCILGQNRIKLNFFTDGDYQVHY